jgi:hypothetical protein
VDERRYRERHAPPSQDTPTTPAQSCRFTCPKHQSHRWPAPSTSTRLLLPLPSPIPNLDPPLFTGLVALFVSSPVAHSGVPRNARRPPRQQAAPLRRKDIRSSGVVGPAYSSASLAISLRSRNPLGEEPSSGYPWREDDSEHFQSEASRAVIYPSLYTAAIGSRGPRLEGPISCIAIAPKPSNALRRWTRRDNKSRSRRLLLPGTSSSRPGHTTRINPRPSAAGRPTYHRRP